MVRFRKTTPILLAEDVKACVEFWATLGLQASVTVPEGEGIGFAIIAGDGVELMYQSFSSARAQRPEAVERVDRSIVFLEVASLDAVVAALPQTEVVVPDHVTDYGAREIYVRDPAGNLIGFSQFGWQE
ncbi:MAG: VOC family protein [Roseitalea porphyridii]|jgi:catechol 2,3-dioxygenase-like lactoylglutathione lyase family enzyme|uniref:VOC family protein n=1 Tax=Alphaproteobacteria TaxID=28211 RepID=UPI0032ED944C